MTAAVFYLPRKPVEAGSPYLNAPLRTEAEVLSLRAAREAAVLVEMPADCGQDGAA